MSTSSPLSDADREALLAYLDGQLDGADGRRLEDRLAAEPALRQELNLLQRSTDALDELAGASAGAEFVRSTMTMVALRAAEEAQTATQAAPARLWRQRLLSAAGLTLVAGLTFWLVRSALGDPAAQLQAELPVLGRLDEWRLVGSYDRLAAIHASGAFAEHVAQEAQSDVEAYDLGRADVASLSGDERDELLRRRQRFEAIEPARREELRQLALKVYASPDGAALLATLERYYDWAVENLSPAELDSLRKLSPDEAAARVSQWQRVQLSDADARTVARWFEETLRRVLPTAKLPGGDLQRRTALRNLIDSSRPAAARFFQKLSQDDVRSLREALTPETAAHLADLPKPQWARVIGPWIHTALREPGGAVNEEDLTAFLEKLPLEQRERLLRLPADEMQQQLRRAYWRDRQGDRPPSSGPARPVPRNRRPRPRPPGPPGEGRPGAGGPREGRPGEDRPAEGPPGPDQRPPRLPPPREL